MTLQNKIKRIINAIKDTDINDIEITSFWGFQKIKLSKGGNSKSEGDSTTNKIVKKDDTVKIDLSEIVQEENNSDINQTTDGVQADSSESTGNHTVIKAPLIGTFYASSKPGEPPFVVSGDSISVGQSICIIEAMKIFNEIESEYSGKIIEVLISDGEPVEYGQALFTIKEE